MSSDVDHHGELPPAAKRRTSMLQRDVEGVTTQPITRRMSRLDPRPSLQYGPSGRRMSQFSRSSGLSLLNRNNAQIQPVQNNYHMEPKTGEKFKRKDAEGVIRSVLDNFLGGEKYQHDMCNSLVQSISDNIKARMKDLGFSSRYKYVCLVTIGQDKNQGVSVASRSIWNVETDNFAEGSYSSGDIFAVATIYALYFE